MNCKTTKMTTGGKASAECHWRPKSLHPVKQVEILIGTQKRVALISWILRYIMDINFDILWYFGCWSWCWYVWKYPTNIFPTKALFKIPHILYAMSMSLEGIKKGRINNLNHLHRDSVSLGVHQMLFYTVRRWFLLWSLERGGGWLGQGLKNIRPLESFAWKCWVLRFSLLASAGW